MTRPPPHPAAGPLEGGGARPEHVQRRVVDGLALLTFSGPDGNRMGPGLVAAIDRALAAELAEPGTRAIVLAAGGADFCAGPWADLPPPGPDAAELPPVIAALCDLCARIETAAKPVVCALQGRVAAGGLALALAARACIADERASFHAPEVRLGRLPAGNGAVRLAWRLGAARAIGFVRAPGPMPATEAHATGLIDALAGDSLIPEALAMASDLAGSGPVGQVVRPGLADAAGYRAALTRARAALPVPMPAHRAVEALVLDSIEGAQLLPADQALAFDLVHAQDAARAPAARALAHLARATRRALDMPETRAPHSDRGALRVALAMAPETLARLVPVLLRGGAWAELLADNREALTEALEAIAEAQLDAVNAGQLTQDQADSDWSRVSGRLVADPAQPPAVALTDPDRAGWLAGMLGGAVPLVQWSAQAQPVADAVAAGHGLALVPWGGRSPRLAELVVRDGTDPETVRRAVRLALALRMTPVRAGGGPWLSRLTGALAAAVARLQEAGVSRAALRATGLVPGLAAEAADMAAAPALPLPVDRLIVLAVINAGARLLEDGRALRPSDLDLAMVLGANWPNWRGGPMAEADSIGPLVIRHELRQAEALDPTLWQPEPMFDEMIRNGWRFEDLNTG